jgi:hypothetical protein
MSVDALFESTMNALYLSFARMQLCKAFEARSSSSLSVPSKDALPAITVSFSSFTFQIKLLNSGGSMHDPFWMN